MEILFTILTGVALLVLLAIVLIGVHTISEELRRINELMANISWGVRAIEKETDMIPAEVPPLVRTFAALEAGSAVIAQRLSSAERRLGAAAELLARKG